jgi:hypothetical protein
MLAQVFRSALRHFNTFANTSAGLRVAGNGLF